MKSALLLITFFLLIQLPVSVLAQEEPDTTNISVIQTTDGNQFIGIIISEDSEKIQLDTDELGIITILKKNISSRSLLSSANVIQGKIWAENTHPTRYFWSPTGYGLKKGEGYYQNLWVLFNQVSFGISDNFSMGFGILPLFLFSLEAAEYSPIWITPKFSIPVKEDKFNLGVGVLAGTAGFNDGGGFGIAYGVGTFGNRSNNLTVGLGYGYAGGEWGNRPVINFGGMVRTGPKGYLLTENYIFPGENGIVMISLGGRTVNRTLGIDYGLFIPLGEDINIAIPWLGLNFPFKPRKK